MSPLRIFFVAVGALLVLHNAFYWPTRSATDPSRAHQQLGSGAPARALSEQSAGVLPAAGAPAGGGAVMLGSDAVHVHQPSVIVAGCVPRAPTSRLTRPLNLLPLALDRCAHGAAAALCAAATRVARARAVLLVPVSDEVLDDWAEFATGARAAGATSLLALAVPPAGASPADARALAERVRARGSSAGEVVAWAPELVAPLPAGSGAVASPVLDPSAPLLGGAAALDAARVLLAAGVRVVLSDVGVALRADPSAHLYNDHDIEAHAVLPGEPRRGAVVSVVDDSMGWSRFAQSLAVTHLAADIFALAPTAEAAALAARVSRTLRGVPSLATPRLATPPPDAAAKLEYALTAEALTPSHDSWRSVGASVRLLPARCFATAAGRTPVGGLVAHGLPPGTSGRAAAIAAVRAGGALPLLSRLPAGRSGLARENPNALLHSAAHDATPAVVASQCAAELPHADPALRAAQAAEDEAREAAGEPRRARPLNFILPSSAPFPPPAECAARDLESLCAVLRSVVGARREALVAVSNKNIHHMLQLYIDGVKRAKVSNALVVALDDETGAWLKERDFPYYLKKLTARGGSTDNHATSGLKFRLLQEFMVLGCSVLLSDVDIAWMRDPFPALYGDADVEGMTDGFDDVSAYGAPGSGVLGSGGSSFRIFARNSGMFYLAATNESLRMMERMAHRMVRAARLVRGAQRRSAVAGRAGCAGRALCLTPRRAPPPPAPPPAGDGERVGPDRLQRGAVLPLYRGLPGERSPLLAPARARPSVRCAAATRLSVGTEGRPPSAHHPFSLLGSYGAEGSRAAPLVALASPRPAPLLPRALLPRAQGLGLSQRVMNYLCFLNTKVLFKYIREEPRLYPDAYTPIGAHVNYHPEKPQRMVDIFKHYQQGQRGVLERWNGGEGLKVSNECKFKGVRPDSAEGQGDPLVAAVLAAGKAAWGGVRWMRFGADGALQTPWGTGTWGGVPGAAFGRQVWLDFFGNTRHLLKLEGELPATAGTAFSLTSTRCTDGDAVKVEVSYAAEDG